MKFERVARLATWLAPSLLSVALATIVAGIVEGAIHTYTPLAATAAAGYAAIYGAPIALLVSIAWRGLWAVWRPHEIIDPMMEDGGAPRLAAWAVVGFVGTSLHATIVFNWVRLLAHKSPARDVIALGSTMIAVLSAIGLILLSRPAVGLLERPLRRVARWARRVWGVAVLRPRYVLGALVLVSAVGLYASWRISIRPRIGHLDLAFLVYPGVLGVAALASHGLWRSLGRRRFIALGALGVAFSLVLVSIGTAVHVRHKRPFVMLEIWGDAPFAGLAIDRFYEIEDIRGELRIEGIKPERRKGATGNPDIVLLTLDTTRADRTPPYGGPAKMPTLQRLAKDGATFLWAFSPGNVTRRSLPSIGLGISPPRVRGRVAGWALKLDPRHILLAERFRAAGYDTAGFFCCRSQFGPAHKLGLIRGFDVVVIERDGAKLAELARTWLHKRKASGNKRPLFLWMHFIELHDWASDPPESKRRRSKRERDRWLYDLTLAKVDAFMGAVLDDQGSWGNPAGRITAVTADHGEGLGDHGQPYHSTDLHNSQIRVPLVIEGVGIQKGRYHRPLGIVDLAPTLLDLAGFVPPQMPTMDGVSVAPMLRGKAIDRLDGGEAYAAMLKDRSVARGQRALMIGRYKYIVYLGTKREELYDIRRDPNERQNLAKKLPKVLARMKSRMKKRRELERVPAF